MSGVTEFIDYFEKLPVGLRRLEIKLMRKEYVVLSCGGMTAVTTAKWAKENLGSLLEKWFQGAADGKSDRSA